MSLHLYPTHSNTASKRYESSAELCDPSQARTKSPVSPMVTICGQPSARWAHTGVTLWAHKWHLAGQFAFVSGLHAHSTPSPGRQLLVIRAREQTNTTGRNRLKAVCYSHKGGQKTRVLTSSQKEIMRKKWKQVKANRNHRLKPPCTAWDVAKTSAKMLNEKGKRAIEKPVGFPQMVRGTGWWKASSQHCVAQEARKFTTHRNVILNLPYAKK